LHCLQTMVPRGTHAHTIALSLMAFPLACASPDAPPGAEPDSPSGGAETGSQGSGGPAEGTFDPGGAVTTYDARIGPMLVAPFTEETRCVHVRLENPEGAFVRRFRTSLGDASHHFVVYRSSETAERLTPTPCAGFSGFTRGEHAIFIAQRGSSELVFPTDGDSPVGLEIAPHQMLRLEMHYLNASPEPIEVTGVASVDTVPLSTRVIPSDLAFWGTTHLNAGGDPPSDEIPPYGIGDTGVMFQAALGGTKSFAATTHQHYRGTRMQIWYSCGPSAASTPIVDSTNWADPPLERFDPPLEFPGGGEDGMSRWGLAYRCQWNNASPEPVGYGESAEDNEMCFLWHYYYPSKGVHLCIDGAC
jgi:Copper type II ascorbate-dependent monooxygenase, C-terminal domain